MTGQLPNRISNSTLSTEAQGPIKSNILCCPGSDKNQNSKYNHDAPKLNRGVLADRISIYISV